MKSSKLVSALRGRRPCLPLWRHSNRPAGTPAASFRIAALGCLVAASLVLSSTRAASPDPAKTRELLLIVQSSAELAERARALQQLALVANSEAIPALTPLLADAQLGQYARDVLELMPDARAGDALREAAARLQGNALVGVINSLGVRREPKSVDLLTRLARDPKSVAAAPALLALGRIGTGEAGRVLEETFGRGPVELRAPAAEALLLVAERDLTASNRPAAQRIYDSVRAANVPLALKTSALRGAILARTDGVALLLEQVRSNERPMRDVALRMIRELPGPQVTPALVRELDRLPAPLQVLVIAALVDRADPAALPAIEARARAGADELRLAALKALGRIGRASSLPILLEAASVAEKPALAEAALGSLARINVPEANVAIQKTLATAAPATRVKLIGVLGERKAEGAIADLLAFAAGAEPEVGKAALRALGLVARPGDLPQLIQLSIAAQGDDMRTLADRAIVTTSMKVLEPARRADAVLHAFRRAPDSATKATLVRPLAAIVRSIGGHHEVFVVLREALQDKAANVHEAALQALADWPDATPTTTLLALANRPEVSPADREVALRGAIRMATNVAAGRERSPLNVVDAFGQANRAVRTREEKLMIVSGLGSLRRPEVVGLLQPYLADPEVQAEASLAVVQVAPALLAEKHAGIQPLLERVAATEKDEDVRKKAARFAKGGPLPMPAQKAKKAGPKAAAATAAVTAGQPASGPLFNGTDLGGWDGDPAVWRVRDGVIVGGSMQGNPRNEFLATTRRYRNFRLKLDYKLVGTEGFVNGGVQFRSVRIAQPPNEMLGYQADIGATHSGSLYDESRRKKFLARADEAQIKRLEKSGEWNSYEIRCEGPKIEITLNGEKTLTYAEADAGVPQDGLIALQIHGNCKAEIFFRNIVVEELPGGAAASSQ